MLLLSVCFILQLNRATEQHPLHFHPASLVLLPHRCLLQWDCPAYSCVRNSSTNPAHLSIHIVFFQSTSPFSLLEAWTTFKSLFRFPCSLSDWPLLLLLAAITSVLCIIKNLSHLSCLPWLLEICCM